ncbi:MAG: NADH-quinone oxidoreductase subunit N [Deltaproteobacteria bacterium]|nr:NADH-quinone oxidoreductase subunit N [Deltaproteobacteria bacterium]
MNWLLFYPELYYFAVGMIFLFRSMAKPNNSRRNYLTAWLLAALGVVISLAAMRQEGLLFFQAYRVDLFSQVFKVLLSIGLFLIISICSNLNGVAERYHAEFYLLLFICTLAMMLLVSSVHILSIYVALELSSYSLYILVALRSDEQIGPEASLKYFLVGIFASAVMLFGVALLYSTTQATYVTEMIRVLPGMLNSPAVAIGLLLTLCGFFFKLAVFPFHFWAPDVYQGAANQATAYIATASKVAAVAILTRMVAVTGDGSIYLVHVLVSLAIVSMTVGNLAALVQKDFKRLLAYSSIAHAGYVMIGILSMNTAGYMGAIFYVSALLIMKFTVFLVVVEVADDGRNMEVSHLAGLYRRSPLLAMALMVAIFSLAGIPPTIGFTGKFLVFIAALEKGYFSLVLIAMINVVISLYYYLMILRAAYLMEPGEDQADIQLSTPNKVLTGVLVAVMVVVGIYPHHLIELTRAAAQLLN